MKKLQLDLPVLLPDVPDQKDQCVHRLMSLLDDRPGIDKLHIRSATSEHPDQLCIHYDPGIISLDRVQTLARQTGAEITHRYGHYVGRLQGIRHARQARTVSQQISRWPGVLSAPVSASGAVRLEFDQEVTSLDTLFGKLSRQGNPVQAPAPDQHHEPTHAAHEHQHDHDDTHEHDHTQEKEAGDAHVHGGGHDHEHGGIFGPNTELIFAILCAVSLAIGFGLSFVTTLPDWVSLILYGLAYFFGGFFTAKEAIEAIRQGEFEIDFLMLVAAAGAGALGEWSEGALLLALFSLGHALEHYAMNRARKSISALADLSAKTATVRRDGKAEEIDVNALRVGDVIIVKPNSKIAADGVVIKGAGPVNQAPITGESVPVDKTAMAGNTDPAKANAESQVFAGTINGTSVLEISVTKAASDSTLARLIKLVNEAESQQSPTQQFTDRFEKWFVPAVLSLVVTLCFAFLVIDEPFSASFYRAMAVLVAASPCALAISTPSAVLSGVARAAREGVLVKGGRPLEDLGELTAIAFDKTGTLTQGKPQLNKIVPLSGTTDEQLLSIAVAVEGLSDHPLASAIVQGGKEKLGDTSIPDASSLKALTGRGVQAEVAGQPVFIGNKALFEEQKTLTDAVRQQADQLEAEGHTAMIVRQGDTFLGVLGVMDTPRPEARQTLSSLKALGIQQMIMLTGDNQRVADAIAQEVGLTNAKGDLLPDAKVQFVQQIREKEGKVAMVGDGVNDAPAMAKSTVGIAMGAAGSDVALETADIALMGDQLDKLPFAIGLSREARRIIRQNLFISLGMVALLIPLTILGIARIGPAVIAHEGSTLIVVFNALRLLAYQVKSADGSK
ncbi:heavy metal translocating P-type ATPase [Spirosoma sp. KUDC1026]|uniref:heavy metal translocating P-type ATPase n=1 Tax=Spirosoma sp. KUDC1026 TaxID=2745947 RepID=UPI00159BB1C9|nr:heavy metal translocating P-type ATPase [Spirosoma sp. KUDC1026]QKZ14081.1 cadmium-translocating P-type ATPase [Spirosoma sp. KUDC1026]